MVEKARVSLGGLAPDCHRCGGPLAGAGAACPRCFEPPRRPIGPLLTGLLRWRLRALILLVALEAGAMAWGVLA